MLVAYPSVGRLSVGLSVSLSATVQKPSQRLCNALHRFKIEVGVEEKFTHSHLSFLTINHPLLASSIYYDQ